MRHLKTSNHTNRKMDFLSEIVERGLYGSDFSTLYAGTRGNDAIDMKLVEMTRDPNYLKVPLDQMNFEQHQSLITIQAVIGAIGDHIFPREGLEEYEGVWSALWDSIFVAGGTVHVGKNSHEGMGCLAAGGGPLSWTRCLISLAAGLSNGW